MTVPSTTYVISLSHIPRDNRVLSHCRALTSRGHCVVAIGLVDPQGTGQGQELPLDVARRHVLVPVPDWSAARRAFAAAALVAVRGVMNQRHVLALACCLPGVGDLRQALLEDLASVAKHPTLIVANDWTALPAAIAAQEQYAAVLHYDTHEFAIEEHEHKLLWRLLFPPMVRAVETFGLARARTISCVSPSIAKAIAVSYKLGRPPEVLMSIPVWHPLPPRPSGKSITVLYHGLFTPNRGLAELISGSATWPSHVRLVLRGRANTPAYDAKIATLAEAGIRSGRIAIEALALPTEILAKTNDADLGVFLPDLTLRQNRMALPNKLFEYLFGGIAPIVPAGTDMAVVLSHYNAGFILSDPTPAGLSKLLYQLTPEQLDANKRAASQAARALRDQQQARTIGEIVGDGVKRALSTGAEF